MDIAAIQVDGGSEFKAGFEDACARLGFPLVVLPPRRPQFNGCVECANATVRTEFWSQHTCELACAAVNEGIDAHLNYYNNHRPHSAYGIGAPNEHFATLQDAAWCPKCPDPAQTLDAAGTDGLGLEGACNRAIF